MEKVILDTNILYSLVGISPNTKVNSDLSTKYELWTTTAVLIEGIVKHRKDLTSIHQLLTPIIKEEIKLISVGFTPLPNDSINQLYRAAAIEDVTKCISDIVDLKIGKEAECLRFIFIIAILGIFEVLKETEGYGFEKLKKDSLQLQLTEALIKGNEQFFLDYLEEKIREGYDAGDEQRMVLLAFNELLLIYLNVFHFNYHQIDCGIFNNSKTSEETAVIANLTKNLSQDELYKKIQKHLDNPILVVSKKRLNDKIDSYLLSISNGLSTEENLTQHAIDFLMRKLEKAFKEKTKIRKNDVFDFLQVFALSLPGYKILTLDKAFISMLESVDHDSWSLINSLGYDS